MAENACALVSEPSEEAWTYQGDWEEKRTERAVIKRVNNHDTGHEDPTHVGKLSVRIFVLPFPILTVAEFGCRQGNFLDGRCRRQPVYRLGTISGALRRTATATATATVTRRRMFSPSASSPTTCAPW